MTRPCRCARVFEGFGGFWRFSAPFCLGVEALSSARVPMLQFIFCYETFSAKIAFQHLCVALLALVVQRHMQIFSFTLQGTRHTVGESDTPTSSACKVRASQWEALLQKWIAQ